MANDEGVRHLYIDDIVPVVSTATGISQRQTRKTIASFCNILGDQLGEGNEISLHHVGRLHPAHVRSYWRKDLNGKRVAQKAYRRIYFTASDTVMRKLNKHLEAGGKNAKSKGGAGRQ